MLNISNINIVEIKLNWNENLYLLNYKTEVFIQRTQWPDKFLFIYESAGSYIYYIGFTFLWHLFLCSKSSFKNSPLSRPHVTLKYEIELDNITIKHLIFHQTVIKIQSMSSDLYFYCFYGIFSGLCLSTFYLTIKFYNII